MADFFFFGVCLVDMFEMYEMFDMFVRVASKDKILASHP